MHSRQSIFWLQIRFALFGVVLAASTIHLSQGMEPAAKTLGNSQEAALKEQRDLILEKISHPMAREKTLQLSERFFPLDYECQRQLIQFLLDANIAQSVTLVSEVIAFLLSAEEVDGGFKDDFGEERLDFIIRLLPHYLPNLVVNERNNYPRLLSRDNVDFETTDTRQTAELTKAANDVLDCLERGLALSKNRPINSPFLTVSPGDGPVALYVQLANCLHDCPDDLKADDHLPLWGQLASTFLKISADGFFFRQQYDEVKEFFEPELIQRIKERKTTFSWFSRYIQRLTILVTCPFSRPTDSGFNVRFDLYRAKLVSLQGSNNKKVFLNDSDYQLACETTGSPHTRTVLSVNALSRRLFPKIVSLPFPYPLESEGLLESTPGVASHVWLRGFATECEIADKGILTPSMFDGHDDFHLSQHLRIHSPVSFLLFMEGKKLYVPSIGDIWSRTKKGRELLAQSLLSVKLMVKNAAKSDPELAKIYSFLGLRIFHEGAESTETRLASLIGYGQNDRYIYLDLEDLLNVKNYYPLLSRDLQALRHDKKAFRVLLEQYQQKFINQFAKDNHQNNLISSITEWIDSKAWVKRLKTDPPKQDIVCAQISLLDLGYECENAVISDDGVIILDTTKETTTSYAHIKMNCVEGQTYVWINFLGDPLYTGDQPPEVEIERYRFILKKA